MDYLLAIMGDDLAESAFHSSIIAEVPSQNVGRLHGTMLEPLCNGRWRSIYGKTPANPD